MLLLDVVADGRDFVVIGFHNELEVCLGEMRVSARFKANNRITLVFDAPPEFDIEREKLRKIREQEAQ